MTISIKTELQKLRAGYNDEQYVKEINMKCLEYQTSIVNNLPKKQINILKHDIYCMKMAYKLR